MSSRHRSRRTALTMLGISLAAFACACASTPTPTPAPAANADTPTIYLVRHAEKQVIEGESDPPLTDQGSARAAALPAAFSAEELQDIDLIISSEYKRTQATVAPLAEQLGLQVETAPAADTSGLALRLRQLKDQQVVVSGHSNTLPAIMAELGVTGSQEIDDGQYGDVFVVTFELNTDGQGRSAKLTQRRFGD